MHACLCLFNIVCYIVTAHLAVCGDTFDLSFTLPFHDYLPPVLPLQIFIRVRLKCSVAFPKLMLEIYQC